MAKKNAGKSVFLLTKRAIFEDNAYLCTIKQENNPTMATLSHYFYCFFYFFTKA